MDKIIKLSAALALATVPILSASAQPQNSDQSSLSLYLEQNYFSWKDRQDNHGWQYVTPLTLSYQRGDFNFGLRRAFIISQNDSPGREGRVAHWSDTSASVAYTFNRESNWPIRLNLSANIPNGKATLSGDEKNAVMDGNLVWQTRFGEGFNITPGINISHSLTDKDVIGVGVSHIFRGKFDPNADVEKDEIDPGNDTILTLQYQHQAERWQADAGLTYQRSGTTTRGGRDYYQKGALLSFDLGGSYAITDQQNLRLNYSHSYRKKDKYINNLTGNLEAEEFNSNGSSHYLSADYGYYFNNKQNLHLLADYLKINSNEYDQINALYIPKRTKWGIGLQYQYNPSDKLQLSFLVKHFKLSDESSPANLEGSEVSGWNGFLSMIYYN